jgi:hypothetical protein
MVAGTARRRRSTVSQLEALTGRHELRELLTGNSQHRADADSPGQAVIDPPARPGSVDQILAGSACSERRSSPATQALARP